MTPSLLLLAGTLLSPQGSLLEDLSLRTADGRYEVQLGALVQVRAQQRLTGTLGSPSFDVRLVRPQLRGHLFQPWIRYFIQPELAGGAPQLLDLQIDIQPFEALGLRVGQFLTPYTRAFLTPVPVVQFFDFSIANTFFRADRDVGAMLFGTPFGGKLEYYAGIFNGNGINKGGDDDGHLLWMARLVYSPLGATPYTETSYLDRETPLRVAFGLDAFASHVRTPELAATDPSRRIWSTSGDVAIHWRAWMLHAEFYRRHLTGGYRPPEDAWGGTVQAGYLFPIPLALGERVSWVVPHLGAADQQVVTFETHVAYYIDKNHLKLQLRDQLIQAGPNATLAPPGLSHLLQLDFQLSF